MLFWGAFTLIGLLTLISTIRRPSVAIGAVWCMYGFEQWAQGTSPIFIKYTALMNISIGSIALIGFVFSFIKNKNIFKNYPPLSIAILLLFAYSYISVQWAPRIDLSYAVWGKYWPYFVTFLLITPFLFTRTEDFQPAFKYFVLVGGVLVYMLTFQVEWFHRRIVLTGGAGGLGHYFDAQLGNPLAVAQLSGYVLFATVLIKNHSIRFIKPFKWVIAAICLVLIIKSGSRGQLIGVIFSLLVAWPIVNKITNLKGFMSVLMFVGLTYGVIDWALDEFWKGSSRWKDSEMEESMGGRFDNAFILLDHWGRSGIKMFIGLGNSASYDPNIIGFYPHFVPFEVLGEEGFIGFAIYIFILISVARTMLRLYRLTKDTVMEKQYFGVLLAMTLYAFLLSMKQGSLLGNMEFFMAAFILAKYERIVKAQHVFNR